MKVFIASSTSEKGRAEAFARHLQRELSVPTPSWSPTVEVWTRAFQSGNTTIAQLENLLKSSDFGVFLFAPDDTLTMTRAGNTKTVKVTRDNVVLECGMFIGLRGRGRAIILIDSSRTIPEIPTDLNGVVQERHQGEQNLESAAAKVAKNFSALGPVVAIDHDNFWDGLYESWKYSSRIRHLSLSEPTHTRTDTKFMENLQRFLTDCEGTKSYEWLLRRTKDRAERATALVGLGVKYGLQHDNLAIKTLNISARPLNLLLMNGRTDNGFKAVAVLRAENGGRFQLLFDPEIYQAYGDMYQALDGLSTPWQGK